MAAGVRDTGFDHSLDERAGAAFASGARSLPDLVRTVPSVYPADTLRAVTRLRLELSAGRVVGTPAAHLPPALDGWPVEHPLDFDWRFTPDTMRLLVDRCTIGNSVALLGCPSLVHEAADRGWRSGIALYDWNPAIVEAIHRAFPDIDAARVDLVSGDPVGTGSVAVTVADPPWYPEHTAAFLWAAARLTRVGGRVLLSLPPETTRPGIPVEREAVFTGATASGLRLEAVEAGALAYRTPPFERNALAAAGAPAMADDWRRGDLAVFTVAERTSVPRPGPLGPPDVWGEESVGAVRIKCRAAAAYEFADPTLAPVTPGDILASVSRRHPSRAAADVWTSGNRVFRCVGPGIFRLILAAVGRGDAAEVVVAAAVGRDLTLAEAALVRRATYQAIELVRREERELFGHDHRLHERDLVGTV